jgi:hypothetical protein
MLDKFMELPVWARWLVGILIVISVDAIHMAWGERYFGIAFFESLVAVLLYWATALGAIAVGLWAGIKVAKRTSRTWFGWIVGIAVLFAALNLRDMTKEIPGVGWRIKKMEQAREEALLYDDN